MACEFKPDEEDDLLEDMASDIDDLVRYIDEVISSIPDPFFTINPNHIVLDDNQALRDLLGFQDPVTGTPAYLFFANQERFKELVAWVEEKGVPTSAEFKLAEAYKSIPVIVHISNRVDSEGTVLGKIVTMTDISERALVEEQMSTKNIELLEKTSELENAHRASLNMMMDMEESRKDAEEARSVAENALKVKGQFLANVSHELRTPINGILGMLDLMSETELTEEQREYANLAKFSADSLLTLINQVLDLSKIESKKLVLEESEFDLVDLMEKAVATLSVKATTKGVGLQFNLDSKTPRYVFGDQFRFKQVILNLLSNAIKFTDDGSVTLSVKPIEKLEDDKLRLMVSVTDTGIGIHPEELESIFDTFTQADGSITRRFGGTGLGLSISKELVEMMGGNILVTSEAGKGSSFTMDPVFRVVGNGQKSSSTSRDVRTVADLVEIPPDSCILIVEDNEVNMKLAQRLLEKASIKYVCASNGEEALEQYANEDIDLILMDIQMPVMDGIEATSKIRANENSSHSPVPIVALTAHAGTEDTQRFMDAGMNDVISKPFRANDFYNSIASNLKGIPASSKVCAGPRNDVPLLDFSKLNQMAGDDTEFVKEVLEMFAESSKNIYLEMVIAHRAGGLEDVAKKAHKLKGSSGTVGAERLHCLAKNTEEAAKNNDLEDLEELIKLMEAYLETTSEEIRSYLKTL